MTLPFRRIYAPSEYVEARDAALESGKIPHGFLDLLTETEIGNQSWITYLGYESDCGALLSIKSLRVTISGLFNTGPKGRGEELLTYLIEHWDVNYLNAFEGPLTELYTRHGFKEVERYPFDPELAHDDWDYERFGTPDLLVMERL